MPRRSKTRRLIPPARKRPAPRVSSTTPQPTSPEAARQRLRPPLNYDEAKIDRLVALERERIPHATEVELLNAAYERWVQDNR
jgi:hypothetical protein